MNKNLKKFFLIFIIILLLIFFFNINLFEYPVLNDVIPRKGLTEYYENNNYRKCYLLTCNKDSNRAQFSKNILEKVGFDVKFIMCLPNNNKVLSNKNTMIEIYKLIANGRDEWAYVFEDDINVLENIKMDEIIQYEKISKYFFYLGVCLFDDSGIKLTSNKINNNNVYTVNKNIRGLHAIGLSKEGAKKLLLFLEKMSDYEYMDMILEKFSEIYPANIVRYDLESDIPGHRGIFFQDRTQFETTI
jgi:hypothetical protein